MPSKSRRMTRRWYVGDKFKLDNPGSNTHGAICEVIELPSACTMGLFTAKVLNGQRRIIDSPRLDMLVPQASMTLVS